MFIPLQYIFKNILSISVSFENIFSVSSKTIQNWIYKINKPNKKKITTVKKELEIFFQKKFINKHNDLEYINSDIDIEDFSKKTINFFLKNPFYTEDRISLQVYTYLFF